MRASEAGQLKVGLKWAVGRSLHWSECAGWGCRLTGLKRRWALPRHMPADARMNLTLSAPHSNAEPAPVST
eukprot:13537979-Alexandrium_andersonii.AAC.1